MMHKRLLMLHLQSDEEGSAIEEEEGEEEYEGSDDNYEQQDDDDTEQVTILSHRRVGCLNIILFLVRILEKK